MSNSNENVRNLKGEGGSVYMPAAAAATGPFDSIQALEAAVITPVSNTMEGTLTSMPLPAGVAIFGKFQSVTLISGKIIAYRAV